LGDNFEQIENSNSCFPKASSECNFKRESVKGSSKPYIWTSENEDLHDYDSIEKKIESSRHYSRDICQSPFEQDKNVSYELDLSDMLKIDDRLTKRDVMFSDSIDSPDILKKSFHLSKLKTVESRHEEHLNLSLNAQLGEAEVNYDKRNPVIIEEDENANDDSFFYPKDTTFDHKAMLINISKKF
jgi:hypothetical protein